MSPTRAFSQRALSLTFGMLVAAGCGEKKQDPTEATSAAETEAADAQASTAAAKPAAAAKAAPADFDALSAKVIADDFKDIELQNQLWTALFQLDQWHLMTFPDSKSVPPGLNIETHDGKKWVMAFTDLDRLSAYAKERKQLDANGAMLGMSVPSQTSFDFFEGLRGIEGVRFNQGEEGWFAPMRNMRAVHAHLKKLGRL